MKDFTIWELIVPSVDFEHPFVYFGHFNLFNERIIISDL